MIQDFCTEALSIFYSKGPKRKTILKSAMGLYFQGPNRKAILKADPSSYFKGLNVNRKTLLKDAPSELISQKTILRMPRTYILKGLMKK